MSEPIDENATTTPDLVPPPSPPPTDPPRFRRLGLTLVLAIAAALAAVVLLRRTEQRRLREDAARRAPDADAGPRVVVAPARAAPSARVLTLPADVRAFYQSTIYAKVSGYVKSIKVDKGDSVRKGQILGVLESPEVDQQVAAAASDLVIKQRTFERYRTLVRKDYVSRQDFDTARAQYKVAVATLRQTRALQEYKLLRAPFDGTVTARYVDPGALIPAATGSTASALPLVDVADLRRLRVTMFVQQDAAAFVREGDAVTIVDDHRPDKPIEAQISLLSRALDPRSRSMLCEVWLNNRDDIYPGTFVHVTLHLTTPSLPTVPSTALLLRNNRMTVAVVRDNHVHIAPVKLGVDDGHTVQIAEGVRPGELVALNLPSEVEDGAPIRPIMAKAAPGAQGAAPGPPPSGNEPRQGRGARPPPRPRGE
jgi:RND family efflux transporter MFP subunit